MKAYHIQTTPRPLPEPTVIGRARTVLCQGRRCRSPLAPVFLSMGPGGVLVLCEACRARQMRVIRETLPILKGLH